MLEATAYVTQFMQGRTRKSLNDDFLFRFALERQLEIIGEASTHLSEALKEEYQMVQLQNIKRFRNIVAHEYFAVNKNTIWSIATEEVPALITTLQKIQEDKNFRT